MTPQWRHLRDEEGPFKSTGHGRGVRGCGELCCPEFDTHAPYEIVFVEGLGRIAKQGVHALIVCDVASEDYVCACGLQISKPQLRAIR